ncbi:hypothetical protein HYT57_03295 [Candidatus Woesearchaeota archaeon]|nr:hypothetical protein [Candidatus Woesearchaeota archaeon]
MKKGSLVFLGVLISVVFIVSACEDAVGRRTPSQEAYSQSNVKCDDPDSKFNATLNPNSKYSKKTTVSYTLKGEAIRKTDVCVTAEGYEREDCVLLGIDCSVKEYYCGGLYNIKSELFPCESGCSNGECLKRVGCGEYTAEFSCIRDRACEWNENSQKCVYQCTDYKIEYTCSRDSNCLWYDVTKQCGKK